MIEESEPLEVDVMSSAGPTIGSTEASNVAEKKADPTAGAAGAEAVPEAPMSKNALKKKRKMEERLASRAEWKQQQKELTKERKRRKRERLQTDPQALADFEQRKAEVKQRKKERRNVDVRIIFDCEFDHLMTDNDVKSLEKQLTRCYSDNRQAQQRCRLIVTGLDGKLAGRLAAVGNVHRSWERTKFFERPYLISCMRAETSAAVGHNSLETKESIEHTSSATTQYDIVDDIAHESLVYLSADAPDTLWTLEEGQTYIIGGIVDHNQHKDLCYNKARQQGIRSARLPIGDYIQISGRKVLTVNQVNEIMLKWLEFRDWQRAFEAVIPRRKLIHDEAEPDDSAAEVAERTCATDDATPTVDRADAGDSSSQVSRAQGQDPARTEPVVVAGVAEVDRPSAE